MTRHVGPRLTAATRLWRIWARIEVPVWLAAFAALFYGVLYVGLTR